MVHRVLLLLILIVATMAITINSQSIYKYEVNVDHLEMPKIDLLIDYGTLRLKKFHRILYTLDGHFDLLQPFTDDLYAIVDIFAEQGNDYFKMMDKRINKLCTFFKDDKAMVAKVIHLTSLYPAITRCPIPEGRIHMYNTHMPIDRLPVEPLMAKGKIRLKIYMEDVLMSDISAYFILRKQKFY